MQMINGFIVVADRCVFILLLMLVSCWAVKLQMMQTYSGEDFSKDKLHLTSPDLYRFIFIV